jgi:hypothetical protein
MGGASVILLIGLPMVDIAGGAAMLVVPTLCSLPTSALSKSPMARFNLWMNVRPLCVFAAIVVVVGSSLVSAFKCAVVLRFCTWQCSEETALQILKLDMLASLGRNINCICNEFRMAPDTMHPYLETPTSLAPPGPHKRLLYSQEVWGGICPYFTVHWGLRTPKCWDWFLIFTVSLMCFAPAVLIFPQLQWKLTICHCQGCENASFNVWMAISAALTRWLQFDYLQFATLRGEKFVNALCRLIIHDIHFWFIPLRFQCFK